MHLQLFKECEKKVTKWACKAHRQNRHIGCRYFCVMFEWMGRNKTRIYFYCNDSAQKKLFPLSINEKKIWNIEMEKNTPRTYIHREHCKVFGLRRTLNKRENAKEEKVEEKDMAKKVCRNKNIDITAKHFNSSGIFSKCPKSRHFSKKSQKSIECRFELFFVKLKKN